MGEEREDVVYHLADEARVERGLRNVRNLLDDVEDLGHVEVVAHSDAVEALVSGTRLQDEIEDLLDEGVDVRACANSLEGLDFDSDDLLEGVDVVSSAQTVLVRRQAEGYAYIRP